MMFRRLRKLPSRRHEKGRRIIKDAYWWLPVIAIFTGMRLEEVAQLQVGDLGTTPSGIPYLQVSEGDGKRVKTQSSIRSVPVHPTLVALGFLGLLIRAHRKTAYFLSYGRAAKRASSATTTLRISQNIGSTRLYREMVDFHSFRHTFATHLYRATKDMFMVGEIIGHKTDKSETPTYVHPDVGQKYEAMGKLDYAADGLDLGHLHPKRG